MIVKVVYMNNSFEFVQNVESIKDENGFFCLQLKNGREKRYDRRLKLIVGNYQNVFHESKRPRFW